MAPSAEQPPTLRPHPTSIIARKPPHAKTLQFKPFFFSPRQLAVSNAKKKIPNEPTAKLQLNGLAVLLAKASHVASARADTNRPPTPHDQATEFALPPRPRAPRG
jgi:hypothetical protein